MLSEESYAELVIKQLLQMGRVSGKDCCGKCPKLANYTTIQENVHHLSTGNYLVSCNLPPDGRSSKERGEQPNIEENAGRQLAIWLLWPKPTDFVTGQDLKRGTMLQHSLRVKKEVADLRYLEQAYMKGSSMLDSCFKGMFAEEMSPPAIASQF